MLGIVIITHGKLSESLLETVNMIMGEQTNVLAITFSAKESLEMLRKKVHEAITPFQECGCLIMTDVIGGSATNICAEFLNYNWVRIITGVNLPMVMEAINQRDKLDLNTLALKVQGSGVKGIVDLKEFFTSRKPKSS